MFPQCLIMLKLLLVSHINPNLSAYDQVHGEYDFNCTPLAPTSTRFIYNGKSAVWGTWETHSVDGWYVVSSIRRYQNFKVWIIETSSYLDVYTLSWFTSHVIIPHVSMTKYDTAAAQDLVTIMSNPAPESPFDPFNDSHFQALFHLAQIFKQATEPDSISPTIHIPIPDVTPPRVPQYDPPRVHVSLVPLWAFA